MVGIRIVQRVLVETGECTRLSKWLCGCRLLLKRYRARHEIDHQLHVRKKGVSYDVISMRSGATISRAMSSSWCAGTPARWSRRRRRGPPRRSSPARTAQYVQCTVHQTTSYHVIALFTDSEPQKSSAELASCTWSARDKLCNSMLLERY